MLFRTKRILAFIAVVVYQFLTGLENGNFFLDFFVIFFVLICSSLLAIILPTAWRYLKYVGAKEEYLLGVTVSGIFITLISD